MPAHSMLSFHRPRRLLASLAAATVATGALAAPSAWAVDPDAKFAEDAFRPSSEIGFRDLDRTGQPRALRNDLTGDLAAQVEIVQSSTSKPTGNSAAELPSVVAQRTALLAVSPHTSTSSVRVEVRVGDEVKGTLALAHPNLIPGADQSFARDSVSFSRRAWSAQLPWQWVQPGMTLHVQDAAGSTGTLAKIDVGAPTEIVINNIQLGMLTNAPDGSGHRFIKKPADSASDYFQTLPVSRMTMAQYEKVDLKKVIVGNGKIYTERSDGEGGVYAGDMRENVGKAQVSTGINLATWGATSSPMNQRQPGVTNQRVIHHSAGMYTNGRQTHGLSGGNGMATLYDSVGNELSHELGHSYGLGHYPGMDNSKTGDDRVRNASHHMDSGWGWIAHRQLMRSNLQPGEYQPVRYVDDKEFRESLAGQYNFNRDTMAGGWDASEVSDYTHATGYSQKRMQNSLRTVVHDLSYPSGYRDWDATAGMWVDARAKTPNFNLPRPKKVGGNVFTLLGGYNPANPEQAVLYPAFRSNYGVSFALPESDPTAVSETRSCWVQINFADARTQYVTLDASNGVKQLNVNIAEDEKPTGAQVACRINGVTTAMGDPITITTAPSSLPPAVVVGQEAGFETLRTEELAALAPVLAGQVDNAAPTLNDRQMVQLLGWSDDLSQLSGNAATVAERILKAERQVSDLAAHLIRHRDDLTSTESDAARKRLVAWMRSNEIADSETAVLPVGQKVTVDNGKCLTFDDTDAKNPIARVTPNAARCTGTAHESWWTDARGRIHPALRPDLCVRAQTPVALVSCSTRDAEQRWVFQSGGVVVRSTAGNSALDLNRSTGRPVLYGRTGTPNQVWRGFEASPNALLARMDGKAIAALWAARGANVDATYSSEVSDSGWHTGPTTLTVVGTDPFLGSPATGEADLGEGWTSGTDVALPEGVTTFKTRATTKDGTSVTGSATAKVDTIAPTSEARIGISRVALSAADDGSGVERIEYRFGEDAWSTYSSSVRLPVTTRDTFQHRAVDVAGNVSDATLLEPTTASASLAATLPTMQHGKSTVVTVEATLPEPFDIAAGDKPVAGSVTLALPDGESTSNGLSDGRVRLRIPADVPAGTHRLALSHDGDSRLLGASRTVTLKVSKAPATITAKIKGKTKKPVFKATKKTVTMTTKVTAAKGVAVSGKVAVKVSRVKTTSRGKERLSKVSTIRGKLSTAAVKLSLPKKMRSRAGTYRLTITYGGTGDVARTSKVVDVTVR